jgi:hypothetical protein
MVGSGHSDSKSSSRTRADGRRSLLVYLDADLIKELKKAALDADRNAYEIVEDAVRDWLASRGEERRPSRQK